MIRFIILFIVGFVFYRAIRSWMLKNSSGRGSVASKSSGEIDDVMVKDPYCKAYFPRRNGISLQKDGKELFFCSEECRDKYVSENQEVDT